MLEVVAEEGGERRMLLLTLAGGGISVSRNDAFFNMIVTVTKETRSSEKVVF